MIEAIIRHEGSAFERRLLTLWPTFTPGFIANSAEYLQSKLQGNTASIGLAQMQIRRAEELEQLGYVTPRASNHARTLALLNDEEAVEYVTGMMRYLTDQLQGVPEFQRLSPEDQMRLTLIGYNQGWDILKHNINILGAREIIGDAKYDNETLDEHQRWLGK